MKQLSNSEYSFNTSDTSQPEKPQPVKKHSLKDISFKRTVRLQNEERYFLSDKSWKDEFISGRL